MSKANPDHRYSDLFGGSDMPVPSWRSRLTNDFRLAIVTMFGVGGALIVFVFACFRFLNGDFLIGLADCGVILITLGVVAYAWWSGDSLLAGRILAVTTTGSFLVIVSNLSISIIWGFSALTANFLLADRHFAVIVSAVLLLTMVIQPHLFASSVEQWSFFACGILVSFYGLIFASQTEIQRRKLADIAALDPLTLAGNRRALRAQLDELLEESQQRGCTVGLAMLDLDHFKRVNDAHGHEEGDRVLVDLVRIVKSSVRQSDEIFRIGGEEFLLLMPDTGPNGLRLALEKLQATLRERLEGPDGAITVSIGAAVLEDDEDIRGWLARADAALYQAKNRGRDRIEFSKLKTGTHFTSPAPIR